MSKIKGVARYLLLFAGLMAAYVLFGLSSLAVSDRAINRNVRQTLEQSDLQVDYAFAFIYKPNYWTDNFTDALIISQALMLTSDSLKLNGWERVMLVPRPNGGNEQCRIVREMMDGTPSVPTIHYPRYWHGSTFLMRILLSIADYVALRTLFYILSSLLLLWVLLAIARNVGIWVSVLYLFSFVLVDGFIMQFSIQFLPALLISLAATLCVVYRKNKSQGLLFFAVGSLTAYFDLLTTPIITWGMPLLVLLAAGPKKTQQLFSSLTWFVGYAATWGFKWLLATLTTSTNVFADATQAASIRSTVADYSRWDAVLHNLELIPDTYVIVAAAILVALALWRFNPHGWKRAILCLAVAAVPILWFIALANHSYEHFWFTHRILMVTVMGLLSAIASFVDWRNITTKRNAR